MRVKAIKINHIPRCNLISIKNLLLNFKEYKNVIRLKKHDQNKALRNGAFKIHKKQRHCLPVCLYKSEFDTSICYYLNVQKDYIQMISLTNTVLI